MPRASQQARAAKDHEAPTEADAGDPRRLTRQRATSRDGVRVSLSGSVSRLLLVLVAMQSFPRLDYQERTPPLAV